MSANGYKSTTANCAKQGYTVLGVTTVDTQSDDINIMKFSTVANIAYIRVSNTSSSYLSNIRISVLALYIKT